MKKVIKLTESDLVRIVKRVISEQTKDGPVAIPKNAEINIDNSVIQDAKKMGISFKQNEKSETFLEKVNKSNFGINPIYIDSDGWRFRVYKTKLDIPLSNDVNITLSCEPFNKTNGVTMCRVTKKIP